MPFIALHFPWRPCWILSKAFIHLMIWSYSFCLQVYLYRGISHTYDLQMLSHSCISGMKLIWSWWMISMCSQTLFASIWLENFASAFIRGTDLGFSLLVGLVFIWFGNSTMLGLLCTMTQMTKIQKGSLCHTSDTERPVELVDLWANMLKWVWMRSRTPESFKFCIHFFFLLRQCD